MPAAGGERGCDGDLAHSHAAEAAAVLAGGAGRGGGGLLAGGLVDDKHGGTVVELPSRPGGGRIQHLLLVPGSPRQQVMEPGWAVMPGRFGDAPAVVVFQLHQQPVDQGAGVGAGLVSRETPGNPGPQFLPQPFRSGLDVLR